MFLPWCPGPFLSWRLGCGLGLRALLSCPVLSRFRARGPWVSFCGFRSVPGPGRLQVFWWATSLEPILSSCFVEAAVRGDMRFGQVPLFLRPGILDLIADPIAIDALMMDNTKEISRHCTVLQPRSYLQSSIPIFLHVYVDLGGTVTDNKIVVLALLLHRRPVGLFQKASVLERPLLAEALRHHHCRSSRVCGGGSLSQRVFVTSSRWST